MPRVVALIMFLAGAAPGWAGPQFPASREEPAAAQVSSSVNRPIDLSAFHAFREATRPHDSSSIPHTEDDAAPMGNDGIAVGPFQTEFDRSTGKHARFARFKLNGVTVLGASVAGSIDGRSAHFQLSWPTSP